MENQHLTQEDEINFRKYVEVIIKRKKLVLNIFLISVLVTAIVSLLMPKIYEVSMIIEPAIIAVTDTGTQYLDSVDNIQAKINAGIYSEKIIKGNALEFNVEQPKDTQFLKISLEEQKKNTELGISILNKLLEEIRSDYTDIIDDKKFEIDNQIALINSQISNKDNEIARREVQLGIQADREVKLFDETQDIKSNSDKLMDDSKSILQTKDSKDDISSFLYTTMIQQNMTYANQLQNDLTNLRVEKEGIKTEAKNLNNDIVDLRNEVVKENILKKEIHNVGLVQDPQVSLHPIKPNMKKNILVSALLGLMIGIFLAFLREFWDEK